MYQRAFSPTGGPSSRHALPQDEGYLDRLVDGLISEVARIAVMEHEVHQCPASLRAYADLLDARFREALARLGGLPLPQPAVRAAAARGLTCLETLVDQVLPRLTFAERFLAADKPFRLFIEDGPRKPISQLGRIDRLGEDRCTGAIVVHKWRTALPPPS